MGTGKGVLAMAKSGHEAEQSSGENSVDDGFGDGSEVVGEERLGIQTLGGVGGGGRKGGGNSRSGANERQQ
jgi:hypothetical protein